MPLKKGANAPYKDLTKNTVVLYFETEYGCMLGLKKTIRLYSRYIRYFFYRVENTILIN